MTGFSADKGRQVALVLVIAISYQLLVLFFRLDTLCPVFVNVYCL